MNEKLAALAASYNTTQEHLWAVLLQQTKVDALLCIASLIAAIAMVWLSKRAMPILIAEYENSDSLCVFLYSVVLLLVTTILCVTSFIQLADLPTLLFNPEYAVMQKLLQLSECK